MSYTPTAADAYFIVGGMKPNEGAVVTKGRLAADDIWRLDVNNTRYWIMLVRIIIAALYIYNKRYKYNLGIKNNFDKIKKIRHFYTAIY